MNLKINIKTSNSDSERKMLHALPHLYILDFNFYDV